MASLQGLPPLPKSLSGLLNFTSAQWKEMERLHTMRTMIQQDLNRGIGGIAERTNLQRAPSNNDSSENFQSDSGLVSDAPTQNRAGRLDVQLALLRKEMVGLRQLDMSLLCQLWSLNESIHEYKQLLQDRMSLSLSPTHASSPGWDNGIDSPSSDEHGEVNNKSFKTETNSMPLEETNQMIPGRKLSSIDSTSHSSLEFGDI